MLVDSFTYQLLCLFIINTISRMQYVDIIVFDRL